METILGGIIALQVLGITIYLLYKKYSPTITLMVSGSVMYLISCLLYRNGASAGSFSDELIGVSNNINSAFSSRVAGVGLLIMFIGGYVDYIKRIKASDAFMYLLKAPLSFLSKNPYLAATFMIPIGLFLSFSVPSALGLGLLMTASVYPVLLGLGVSKLTALSIISASTLFDLGLTSSNTITAAGLLSMDVNDYFLYQVKVAGPVVVLVMLIFYYFNKKFDGRLPAEKKKYPQSVSIDRLENTAPLWYGILPILPIIVAVVFSHLPFFSELSPYVCVSNSILVSFLIASLFELVNRKNMRDVFDKMNFFWYGMSRTFRSAVVLLVAADIFSQALIKLGFMDMLLILVQNSQSQRAGITILMTLAAFMVTLVTGSGTAVFTSIGSVVPTIALQMDLPAESLMLPIQLITGVARTASPMAIVIIAISEIAGVSPMSLARRNIIPVLLVALLLIASSFIMV